MWKDIFFKILLPIVLIISLVQNYNQFKDNQILEKSLEAGEELVAIADNLVSVDTTKQGSTLYTYNINNSIDKEASRKLIERTIDSLSKEHGFKVNKSDKEIRYSSTKFTSKLRDAKATVIDSVASYADNNWKASYNYKTTSFDLDYESEIQDRTYEHNTNSIFGFPFGKPKLYVDKMFTDTGARVVSSTTMLYLPSKTSNHGFNINTNTEYRSGLKSLHQGIEMGYRFKRFGIGAGADIKVLGPDFLPDYEYKLNLKYFIVK